MGRKEFPLCDPWLVDLCGGSNGAAFVLSRFRLGQAQRISFSTPASTPSIERQCYGILRPKVTRLMIEKLVGLGLLTYRTQDIEPLGALQQGSQNIVVGGYVAGER